MVSEETQKLSDEYLERCLSKEGQKISRQNRKLLLKEYKTNTGIFSPEENEFWSNQYVKEVKEKREKE